MATQDRWGLIENLLPAGWEIQRCDFDMSYEIRCNDWHYRIDHRMIMDEPLERITELIQYIVRMKYRRDAERQADMALQNPRNLMPSSLGNPQQWSQQLYNSARQQAYFTQFTDAATCCFVGLASYVVTPYGPNEGVLRHYNLQGEIKVKKKDEHRKQLKSECNAQQLLREMIGFEQWQVYRKTNRVIAKPGKHWWLIGDIFGSYNKDRPFSGKPDVVRIDNPKKNYGTSFCFQEAKNHETPFTDKVVTFASHLMADEKSFYKTGNRINEVNLKKVPESAVWES